MMMMRILIYKIVLLIVFSSLYNRAFSQGLVENELSSNQVLVSKFNALKSALRTGSITDTLQLGILGIREDFSSGGPYPDTALWLDNFVYINRDFPKAPPTIGVATFEGLDYTGLPYDFSAGPSSSALADYLTSKPINLNYPVGDSIYFSFYYQPQGRGNSPEYNDSLVLQFKRATGWSNVWAERGTTLASNDSSWTRVMIPVTDTAYLKNGFQFRFYNRATISGNTDHWSIDYAYLNRFRTKNDTINDDIAFVYNAPPMINTYSAMPWKQYDTTYMKIVYSSTIRNNFTATKPIGFTQKIYDGSGVQVGSTYSGGTFNIDPFATSGYMNYQPMTMDTIGYTIPSLSMASKYTIESILNTFSDNEQGNDTVRYVQDLTNYFAYDDGTAENSFGMSTLYGQLAEKFVLNVADTLQFIDIYFNPFLTNTSIYTFTLKVWNEVAGVPGVAMYTDANVRNPAYGGVVHNQFIRYKLETPLYLSPGVFYAGFMQNTNQFLNIGVDKNTNTQMKIFYNVSGSWNNSPFAGSLMLHPVFGSASEFTGITTAEIKNHIAIYPNPSSDKLFISVGDAKPTGALSYSVMDMMGRKIIENESYSDHADISGLNSGVYFISVYDGKNITTLKFIKTN